MYEEEEEEDTILTYLCRVIDIALIERMHTCILRCVCLYDDLPTYLSMKISDTSALPMLSIVSDVTVLKTINPMN